MMKLLLFLVVVLCLVGSASAADYTVSTSTSVVDGTIYCDGVCDATDTIIIDGGARGSLLLKNFDGDGSYITITNEDTDPDSQVVITGNGDGGTWSPLELRDCKYVDLRGDNDADIAYGIKVIYDDDPVQAGVVWVRQESDHIKISYLEISDISHEATGLMVLDGTLSDAWIFDTFEIHHNYIHDTGYSGMYLGMNNPPTEFDPYISNFSVHDNLMEDMGAYGMTLKGVHADSDVCLIYNNTVRPSDRSASGGNSTGLVFESDGSAHQGIGVQYYYGSTYANIYDNWVEKTRGPGFKIGDQNHNVYNNTIVGCGVNNSVLWGHGIVAYNHLDGGNFYDNIIIQPVRYGVYGRSGTNTDGATMSRNLIGDAGVGEWGEETADRLVESSGADANTYYADVATFGFDVWSDDDDFSNDEFTFLGDSDDTYDNTLKSSTPDTVNNDVEWLSCGMLSGDIKYRSVIWFNLSEYNSTDTVDSALLNLTWYFNGTGRNKSTNVGIYLANATTDTDYLNWNNSSNGVAWREPGGNWLDANWADNGTTPFASVLIPNTAADDSAHSFDITELVQAIVNESRTNNGFFIISNETNINYIAFASLDHTTEAYNPTLNITHSIAEEDPTADFTYHKIITLNQSMINQSIGTGKYPLLVSDIDTDLRDNCQADGDDIVFFDADNSTQLPHENETWNSTTGEIVHWVGIEDVTNVSHVVMYYGNATMANSENATGVWDSNYMMVQHFQETDIDGGAGDIKDSTSNDNDGTTSAMSSANQEPGKIDGSFNFSASTDAIVNITDDSTLDGFTSGFTISGWYNFNAEGAYYLISKYETSGDQRAWLLKLEGNDNLRIYVDDAGTAAEISNFNPTIVPGTWYKLDAVWESGEYPLLYFDGALANEVDRDGLVSSIKDSSTILRMGRGYSPGDTFFTGDENRISNIARSHAYIETDYNNSAYPTLFISIGTEQTEADTTPPLSITSLTNTTGNFWHNWTWTNPSDADFNYSYILINNSWISNTSNEYYNLSADAHNTSTISIKTVDTTGNMNTTWVNHTSTIPNNAITISNISTSYTLNEGETLSIDADATDADSDTPTFNDNSTDWNVNSATGIVSWVTADGDNGIHNWYINVSDGYGSTDQYNFTVTINDSIYDPTVTMLSQTPSEIYQNSTGYMNISYGITHDTSGLNNTSVSFIYRNYDPLCGCSNHSIMVPDNDKATVWDLDGQILRAQNRNETLNFEDNTSITGGDIYTWSGLDENSTRLTIVPVNSTYTLIYINATVHDVMPQMWYLDRTDLEEAPKTQIAIHKTQNLLIKLWNLELFKGNYDHITAGYTDTDLEDNPALHPSDANPLNYYYVNESYDPATGGDPLTSGYAFYMGSGNASEWIDHVYSPHANSNYVRSFINNTLLNQYINTTEISYLYLTSNTASSKPYYINVTDIASSTNVSFADTNVLWTGDTTLTQQSYTPNVWLSFMKDSITFDHKLYVADNNGKWDNSTLSSTVVGAGLFPPTKPSFYAFHNGYTDNDMNGTYHDTIQIQIGISTDPDGGNVNHNLTLHYSNETLIEIINNTVHTPNGIFVNVSFNTTSHYSENETYTLRLIATDDESENVTTWLGVNFSLGIFNYDNFTFTNTSISPTAVRENDPFTVTVDINDSDGTISTAIVKISSTNYTMTNTGGDTWSYTFTSTSTPTTYYVQNFYAQDNDGDWNSTSSTLSIDVVSSTGTGSSGGISPTATPTPTPTPTAIPTTAPYEKNITDTLEGIKNVVKGQLGLYEDGNYISIFEINFNSVEKTYTKDIYIENHTKCTILENSSAINDCTQDTDMVTISMPFIPEDEGLFYSTRDYFEIEAGVETYYVNVDILVINIYDLFHLDGW